MYTVLAECTLYWLSAHWLSIHCNWPFGDIMDVIFGDIMESVLGECTLAECTLYWLSVLEFVKES